MVDVSVVIPYIHEFPAIYQTVFAIQNEFIDENFTYEIVAVENGERDPHTEKFLHVFRILQSQGKFKYTFEPRQCAGTTRNTGAKTAQGKYLVYTDAHVVWGKNTFPLLVETLEKHDAGIVHGSTSWSHHDVIHMGCHYKLFGTISLLTHGHGTYQRCRGRTKPYRIANGTGAYIIFKREEFLKLHGYHEACRYYPHPEAYTDLKYWMFEREVWLNPRAFHYHSLYPRNYGKGAQDYCGYDHHVENVMICLYTLGGEEWLNKVYDAHIKKGDKPERLDVLMEQAKKKAEEERRFILDNAHRTLTETINWMKENNIAGVD